MEDNVLHPNDPIQVGLGIMAMVMPAALAFEVAKQLKEMLLDRYEPAPGVPTPDNPNPGLVFRLKEDADAN